MDNKRIYFGQVKKEDVKQQHQQYKDKSKDDDQEDSSTTGEFLPFSKHTKRSQEQHQKVLDEYERKKRAKQVIVPTIDNLVKLKLRELAEPIILFGEKPEDRRSRLRNLLIERNILDGTPLILSKTEESEDSDEEKENFLTEGTEELKKARLDIAMFSLKKTQSRLLEERKKREIELNIKKENEKLIQENEERILKKQRQQFELQKQRENSNGNGDDTDDMMIDNQEAEGGEEEFKTIKTEFEIGLKQCKQELINYYASVSQIGDERPLSMGVFSPDSNLVAIGSWSGQTKLWSATGECKEKQIYTGHSQRVSCVAFHPASTGITNEHSASIVNVATTSADHTCKLWSLESSTPLGSLDGHTDVVNRCCFHPCGRYITTSSSDKSWRMWDIENSTCLLDQEGHSDSVMGIAIQSDGSLLASGSQDGLVRIWDLRSGRPVLYFQGHSKQVISVDWSPNSYLVASSSEDNSVIIWDIRKKEQSYQILAHNSIVSCVKFNKTPANSGVIGGGIGYLATCSFDGKIKTFEPTPAWKLISTYEGHSSRVTSIDISSCNSKILSTSFDKTWKIWSNDN